MTTYYLLDHSYVEDKERFFGEFGHLLAFNPGSVDAKVKITLFFEDRDPVSFDFFARAGQSAETNYAKWPVEPGTRFAMQVESTEPLVCQSTVGWNATLNNYSPDAETKSPRGLRECAKSYMAITELAQNWYVADGIVIDKPDKLYVRESEWAIILNPAGQPTDVTLRMHYADVEEHSVTVPARRIAVVPMDDVARRNSHYGVHFVSGAPVAVQWLRAVLWNDSDEIMA